jgi:hypothetical protein
MHLQRSIMLMMFLVVAIPLALVVGGMRSVTEQTLKDRALELARERVDRLRLQISERLNEGANALEELANRGEWAASGRDAQRRDLEALLAHRERSTS